jgi:ribosomal protein S18 acetylase RimI-like enzyme
MIRKLIDSNVESGRLLSKATVTLYEDVQEFCVAELVDDGALAGCGALHVMWEDLAEIRTVAVVPDRRGLGIGHAVVGELLALLSRLTSSPATVSSPSAALPWPRRCTRSYCVPMTRAWPSFSTWSG